MYNIFRSTRNGTYWFIYAIDLLLLQIFNHELNTGD